MNDSEIHARLVANVEGVGELDTSAGDPCVGVSADAVVDALGFLRDDDECSMEMLHCVTAVDREKQVDVVYHVCSYARHHSLTLKVELPKPEGADEHWHPEVPTACGVYPAADWHEREQWDLLGVRFTGHPDMRRILLPEEWIGHPLRKDYVYPSEHGGIPLELDAVPLYEREGESVGQPAPTPREPGAPLNQPPSEPSKRPHAGGKAPAPEKGDS